MCQERTVQCRMGYFSQQCIKIFQRKKSVMCMLSQVWFWLCSSADQVCFKHSEKTIEENSVQIKQQEPPAHQTINILSLDWDVKVIIPVIKSKQTSECLLTLADRWNAFCFIIPKIIEKSEIPVPTLLKVYLVIEPMCLSC